MLLVVTARSPDIPERLDPDGPTTRTPTCIVIGTVAEDDSDVVVRITDQGVTDEKLIMADSGQMNTAEGFIAIETTLGDRLLVTPVRPKHVLVEVWVSDTREPDLLAVHVIDA